MNSAPNSAAISGSDRRAAGPKPNGSATVIGRSTKPVVLRNERQGDAIAGKGPQREQRLQAGDAAADDDNVA